MALMFSRLAHNFAKNGYYPTDEESLSRVLQAIQPSSGRMRILDPCAGEGAAIADAAHHLGRDSVDAYGIEYDNERAQSMMGLVDTGLQGDFMDMVVSPRSMGLLWLNPPYGDLVADHQGYQGTGRKRLEKLFYQRSIHSLQYGGVMVLIIPVYSLDKELTGWLSNHFTNLRVFQAAVDDFQQVVIIGNRVRRHEVEGTDSARHYRKWLLNVGLKDSTPEVIPSEWLLDPYVVPTAKGEMGHFYRVSIEPEQLAQEVGQLGGLWNDLGTVFSDESVRPRPPVRRLSQWHLALSLAAGAITGVVQSSNGRCLVVKGDTHKDKVAKTEFTENEDGSVTETRVMTDRFVPRILGWEMTPGSAQLGQLLTITSKPPAPPANESLDEGQPEDETSDATSGGQVSSQTRLQLGRIVVTRAVNELVAEGAFNPMDLLRRHVNGDWGDISEDDRALNNTALTQEERVMSAYQVNNGLVVWIITEADRSVTTLLLPQDY